MEISLYKALESNFICNGLEYYKEQDISSAGQEECDEIYINEPLTGEHKNYLAKSLIETLVDYMEEKSDIDMILDFIERYPFIKYYFVLVDKLQTLVNEDIISEDKLFSTGLYFIKKREESPLIKLGLALLKVSKKEEAIEQLMIFSNHNDYIFYAVEGIKSFRKSNSIIFEIAKGSRGYGKIIVMSNLEPLNKEIKEWIVESGANNEFLEPVLAAMVFDEYEYSEYFFSKGYSEKAFNLFTNNLLKLYEVRPFFYSHISYHLISLYYEYFRKCTKNLNNLYLMCILLSFVKDKDIEVTYELNEEEGYLIDDMKLEFLEGDYRKILIEALRGNEETEKVVEIAICLEVKLEYNLILPFIEENSFNSSSYQYLLSDEGEVLFLNSCWNSQKASGYLN